jgi:hypothetical protein
VAYQREEKQNKLPNSLATTIDRRKGKGKTKTSFRVSFFFFLLVEGVSYKAFEKLLATSLFFPEGGKKKLREKLRVNFSETEKSTSAAHVASLHFS